MNAPRSLLKKIRRESRYIWSVFEVNLHLWGVYRLKLVIWILTGLVEPIIWSVLWFVTAQNSEGLAMTGPEILTYYLFISLVSRLTRSWTFDDLRKEIVHGKYSKYMLWPTGVTGYRWGADWANKVVTVLMLLPFWIFWLWILVSNGLFALEPTNIVFFLIALGIATSVRFFMDMVLAHLVLWTEQGDGLAIVYYAVSRLFGGIIVPLALLPAWAHTITKLLPFRYLYSFPIEVFQGVISDREMVQGFAIAVGWLVFWVVGLQIILKVGLRRYEAAGI
jgi:ABC-2 type transport system permease protein